MAQNSDHWHKTMIDCAFSLWQQGLMKSTLDDNFTNILQAAILFESVLEAFCTYSLTLYFFWQKNIGAKAYKAAYKMLVKLTKGINFTHMLSSAFSQQLSQRHFV